MMGKSIYFLNNNLVQVERHMGRSVSIPWMRLCLKINLLWRRVGNLSYWFQDSVFASDYIKGTLLKSVKFLIPWSCHIHGAEY